MLHNALRGGTAFNSDSPALPAPVSPGGSSEGRNLPWAFLESVAAFTW